MERNLYDTLVQGLDNVSEQVARGFGTRDSGVGSAEIGFRVEVH